MAFAVNICEYKQAPNFEATPIVAFFIGSCVFVRVRQWCEVNLLGFLTPHEKRHESQCGRSIVGPSAVGVGPI